MQLLFKPLDKNETLETTQYVFELLTNRRLMLKALEVMVVYESKRT